MVSACAVIPPEGQMLTIWRMPGLSVQIRNMDTKEVRNIRPKRLNGPVYLARLEKGRYHILKYNTHDNAGYNLEKFNINFTVVDGCVNYAGKLRLTGHAFKNNGQPSKIYWRHQEDDIHHFHSWLKKKLMAEAQNICVPKDGGIAKYEWQFFKDKFLSDI